MVKELMTRRVYAIIIITILFIQIFTGCVSSDARKELAREYYNLGNSYYTIQDFDRAVDFFNQALALDPKLLDAHYNLSLALIKQGRGEKAEALLLKLLEETPENISILQILSYSYFRQGKVVEAISVLDTILEISADNRDALYNKGLIYWKNNEEEQAVEEFLKLLSVLPENGSQYYTDTLYNLGRLFMDMKDARKAAAFLERYLVWKEEDVEVNLMLAESYKDMEQYGSSLEVYTRLLVLDSSISEAWMAQAEILLTKIQDPREGLKALDQALSRGFSDHERLTALLDNPELIEKEGVADLLKSYSLPDESE
jgi:tetratricopeptide (TPR) repeat protein